MTIATAQKLTLQAFLDYDDGTETRYELENGVLVEMGNESTLNGRIASFLFGILCTLNGKIYHSVEFRGDDVIISPAFPSLNVNASQILQARR